VSLPDPLASFGRDPARAGLFLDFDGVLSDIAEVHDGARPRPAVPELITALVSALGRVAIISGRPVSYLAGWLPVEVDLVGLYGLEWRTGGAHHSWDGAEAWREVIQEVADAAATRFGSELVEPKGLSLTIHYRNEMVDESSVVDWTRARAVEAGLELRGAKMSVELHPPVGRDKGTALLELADALDPVAFMGDDLGDLPAFDALDELERAGVETIRIAVDSAEAPMALLERADVVVDGPEGAERLLEDLVEVIAA
jgi:trehalose 6-phosphate phosphatase